MTAAQNHARPSFTRTVHWLTGAYPDGLPADERPALVEFLAARLTREQLHQALVLLTPAEVDPGQPRLLSQHDVEALVAQATKNPPTVQEQHRLAGRLARAGWPLLGDI